MKYLPRHSYLLTALLAGLLGLPLFAKKETPPPPVVSDTVVELPALLVEDRRTAPDWLYTCIPGVEILSRCNETTTETYVRGLVQSRHMVDLLLPETFHGVSDVPEPVILYSQVLKPKIPKSWLQQMFQGGPSEDEEGTGVQERILPNLRISDKDLAESFVFIDERKFDGRIILTERYIRKLLETRTPQLPTWFIDGYVRYYAGLVFHENGASVLPSEWLTAEETQNLVKDPDFPRALLPMRQLFATGMDLAAPLSKLDGATRLAQSALFIRWALHGSLARRKAFVRFVERSCNEPPSEALFEECFGIGYTDALERLSDYLSVAVSQPIEVTRGNCEIPDFKVRKATETEVARIKGDWERMQVVSVKKMAPAQVRPYEAAARKTFERVQAAVESSPEIMVSLGLFECEQSNGEAAERLLEMAVKAQVARPRPYLELARLRLARARACPSGAEGKLSREQVRLILEPLFLLEKKQPQMPETFLLLAGTLHLGEALPSSEQLALLANGVKEYPKMGNLALLSMWLFLSTGDVKSASQIVESALVFNEDSKYQDHLLYFKKKFTQDRLKE